MGAGSSPSLHSLLGPAWGRDAAHFRIKVLSEEPQETWPEHSCALAAAEGLVEGWGRAGGSAGPLWDSPTLPTLCSHSRLLIQKWGDVLMLPGAGEATVYF